MNKAQEFYIISNYKTMSVDDLCKDTSLGFRTVRKFVSDLKEKEEASLAIQPTTKTIPVVLEQSGSIAMDDLRRQQSNIISQVIKNKFGAIHVTKKDK